MIDYKIRNRANRVVLKGQQGLNLNFDWFKFGNSLPSQLQSLVNSGLITTDTAWNMFKNQSGIKTQTSSNATAISDNPNNQNNGNLVGINNSNEGSITQPSKQPGYLKDGNKKAFAEKNGYILGDDGKFYGTNTDGSRGAEIQVSDDQLKEFSDQQTAGLVSGIANTAFSVANNVLDATSKIDQKSSFGSAFQQGWDSSADLVGEIYPAARVAMRGLSTGMRVVDNLFAKNSDSFAVDQNINSWGSYGGAYSQAADAESRVGKYGGLFDNGARKRTNRAIAKAKRNQSIINDIDSTARQQQDLVNAMGDQSTNAYNFNLTGGYKQQSMRAAKEGGVLEFEPEILMNVPKFEIIVPGSFALGGVLPEKIDPSAGGIVANKEWTPDIVIDNWTPEIVTVGSFKPGGRIAKALDAPETEETEQKSVIPEGSLHKDKHHMENTEGMTKKGIPVVDDDSKQQAEIERNEIIFTKEVTKKLEELYKVYYDDDSSAKEKDEAAIDAGKLLTKEIMLNTDDRTGLIETLQSGGALNYKGEPYTGRSLDELVEYAEKMNPRFIQRLNEFAMILPFKDKETGETHYGSHLLGAEYNDAEWQSDENPGPVYVFPSIMETEVGNGNLKYWKSPNKALQEALKRGDYLKFDNLDEAEYFTNHYKEHYNTQLKDFDDMERYLQAHPKANPVTVRKMFMELSNEITER